MDVLWIGMGLAAPLAFAALGGYFSERGGVIAICLEGMMLLSACLTALVGFHRGPVIGLLAGLAGATLLALIHWAATQKYRVDHVVSGMAVNALAAGGTNFANGRFGVPSAAPVVSTGPLQMLALLLPVLAFWAARRTAPGWRLEAVGADPDKARLVGLHPSRVRLGGLLLTGLLTGLGGAYLVAETGVFTDNMTAGRGYIALAALILSGYRPIPALAACLAFGLLNALSLQFQGRSTLGVTLPGPFWTALPYLITVVALAGFLGQSRTHAGLGRN